MIVDNVWKLTNTVRVVLDARSSHVQRQSSFPEKLVKLLNNDPSCVTESDEGFLLTKSVFISNWIKKRREPRVKNVTLKL